MECFAVIKVCRRVNCRNMDVLWEIQGEGTLIIVR